MLMKVKRTTIQDIADKTGYSKTAVSFAFNSPSRISKEAVEAILKAAEELDYIPDPMARNFSLGKHMSLGFLLPQRVEYTLMNPYMQEVMRGIAEVCQEHGYMLTLIPPLHSSVIEAVKNATVDGIITLGLAIDKNIKGILRQRQMPIVAIDGSFDDEIHSVSVDDVSAAELQLSKVLEKGHRDIAIISLPEDAYAKRNSEAESVVKKRKKGYMKALEKYSMSLSDLTLVSTETTLQDGINAARTILKEKSPTCFVTMSDAVALGIIEVLDELNLNISVIGFDGIEEDGFHTRRLTTIHQSGKEKGMRSAEVLFSLINGEQAPIKTLIPYYFSEGTTLKEAL